MGTTGAAIIAVLLLSYAFVQSTVMQAAAASPDPGVPICGMDHLTAMAAAAMAHGDAGKAPAHHSGHTACPFCAAAANVPLVSVAILTPAPSTLAFVAFQDVGGHGPRGPPTQEPRARGPPSISLNA